MSRHKKFIPTALSAAVLTMMLSVACLADFKQGDTLLVIRWTFLPVDLDEKST